MSKISRELALELISKLLKPERKAELKGAAWGKEIGAIGYIYQQYPDKDFWLQINIFQVNSCIFFRGEQGRIEIEKQWQLYLFDKSLEAKKQKSKDSSVDKTPNQSMIQDKKVEPKQGILDWIDSN